MIPHDLRVAVAARLMRDSIDPALRPLGEGALLLVFPVGKQGTIAYIANADRHGCRMALRDLLGKWDQEAVQRGDEEPQVTPATERDRLRALLIELVNDVQKILAGQQHCGDPHVECPLQDAHKDWSTAGILKRCDAALQQGPQR